MGEGDSRTGGASENSRCVGQIRTGGESSRGSQRIVGFAICEFRHGKMASMLQGPTKEKSVVCSLH